MAAQQSARRWATAAASGGANLEQVKQLRARTQAGILNCKKALEVQLTKAAASFSAFFFLGKLTRGTAQKAANGDIERAIAILKAEGAVLASKKTDKVTAEGAVVVALDGAGRGVLLEINCQTDFAARGESFKALAPRIARAALALPRSVADDDLAALAAVPLPPALPSDPVDSLADQIDSASVAAALTSLTARIGEAVRVRRFRRLSAPAGGILAGYAHGGGGNGILPVDAPGVVQGRAGSLVTLELQAAKAPAALTAARAQLGAAAGKLAQHIVGFTPQFVSAAEITDAYVAQRHEMAKKAAAVNKNADDAVSLATRESIARSSALLEQPYPVEAAPTVAAALAKHAAAAGIDAIVVRAFARYECGDGIVKEADNYAAEVEKLASR